MPCEPILTAPFVALFTDLFTAPSAKLVANPNIPFLTDWPRSLINGAVELDDAGILFSIKCKYAN